ncbi:hypothetical protein EMCRGX_G020453 [Ephydatia muelleri]
MDDVPPSTAKAVAQRLKHYIDVQRREEGFDLSDSKNRLGEFTSTKGGSYYYHNAQDRCLKYYTQQPLLKHHLETMGIPSQGASGYKQKARHRRRTFSQSETSASRSSLKTTKAQDCNTLLHTTAQLVASYSAKVAKKDPSSQSSMLQSVPKVIEVLPAKKELSPSRGNQSSSSLSVIKDSKTTEPQPAQPGLPVQINSPAVGSAASSSEIQNLPTFTLLNAGGQTAVETYPSQDRDLHGPHPSSSCYAYSMPTVQSSTQQPNPIMHVAPATPTALKTALHSPLRSSSTSTHVLHTRGVEVQTDAIVKHDVGITVSVPCDACTQTPIDAEVQTDLCMHNLAMFLSESSSGSKKRRTQMGTNQRPKHQEPIMDESVLHFAKHGNQGAHDDSLHNVRDQKKNVEGSDSILHTDLSTSKSEHNENRPIEILVDNRNDTSTRVAQTKPVETSAGQTDSKDHKRKEEDIKLQQKAPKDANDQEKPLETKVDSMKRIKSARSRNKSTASDGAQINSETNQNVCAHNAGNSDPLKLSNSATEQIKSIGSQPIGSTCCKTDADVRKIISESAEKSIEGANNQMESGTDKQITVVDNSDAAKKGKGLTDEWKYRDPVESDNEHAVSAADECKCRDCAHVGCMKDTEQKTDTARVGERAENHLDANEDMHHYTTARDKKDTTSATDVKQPVAKVERISQVANHIEPTKKEDVHQDTVAKEIKDSTSNSKTEEKHLVVKLETTTQEANHIEPTAKQDMLTDTAKKEKTDPTSAVGNKHPDYVAKEQKKLESTTQEANHIEPTAKENMQPDSVAKEKTDPASATEAKHPDSVAKGQKIPETNTPANQIAKDNMHQDSAAKVSEDPTTAAEQKHPDSVAKQQNTLELLTQETTHIEPKVIEDIQLDTAAKEKTDPASAAEEKHPDSVANEQKKLEPATQEPIWPTKKEDMHQDSAAKENNAAEEIHPDSVAKQQKTLEPATQEANHIGLTKNEDVHLNTVAQENKNPISATEDEYPVAKLEPPTKEANPIEPTQNEDMHHGIAAKEKKDPTYAIQDKHPDSVAEEQKKLEPTIHEANHIEPTKKEDTHQDTVAKEIKDCSSATEKKNSNPATEEKHPVVKLEPTVQEVKHIEPTAKEDMPTATVAKENKHPNSAREKNISTSATEEKHQDSEANILETSTQVNPIEPAAKDDMHHDTSAQENKDPTSEAEKKHLDSVEKQQKTLETATQEAKHIGLTKQDDMHLNTVAKENISPTSATEEKHPVAILEPTSQDTNHSEPTEKKDMHHDTAAKEKTDPTSAVENKHPDHAAKEQKKLESTTQEANHIQPTAKENMHGDSLAKEKTDPASATEEKHLGSVAKGQKILETNIPTNQIEPTAKEDMHQDSASEDPTTAAEQKHPDSVAKQQNTLELLTQETTHIEPKVIEDIQLDTAAKEKTDPASATEKKQLDSVATQQKKLEPATQEPIWPTKKEDMHQDSAAEENKDSAVEEKHPDSVAKQQRTLKPETLTQEANHIGLTKNEDVHLHTVAQENKNTTSATEEKHPVAKLEPLTKEVNHIDPTQKEDRPHDVAAKENEDPTSAIQDKHADSVAEEQKKLEPTIQEASHIEPTQKEDVHQDTVAKEIKNCSSATEMRNSNPATEEKHPVVKLEPTIQEADHIEPTAKEDMPTATAAKENKDPNSAKEWKISTSAAEEKHPINVLETSTHANHIKPTAKEDMHQNTSTDENKDPTSEAEQRHPDSVAKHI